MNTMASFTNPALTLPVNVKVMQIIIVVTKRSRLRSQLVSEGRLVVTAKAEAKVLFFVRCVKLFRVVLLQKRLIVRGVWRMAIPANTVNNRFMLGDRSIHDVLNSGVTAQAIAIAGLIQHGNIVSAMNAVTHLAVHRPDRPVHIFTIVDVFMANQAKFAA